MLTNESALKEKGALRASVLAEDSLSCYFRGARQGDNDVPVAQQKDEEKSEPDKAIFCKNCNKLITRAEQKIQVSGSHTHTFFNPAGLIFELGCFQKAPGATQAGETTSEFSWFAGHVWRFAFCGGCGEHLGWHYETGESSFFGLILAHLME